MKAVWTGMLAGIVLAAAFATPGHAADAAHRLGVGANYWVVLDDLDKEDIRNLDDNGLSTFVSYQYWPSLLGIELQLEQLPDWLGQDKALAPQAYLLLGSSLYAAAGIGLMRIDGDWADKPFYALKAGFNLELLPSLFLDIAANYRFSNETQLEDHETDIDSDTVFLGAALRLGW